ncbi:MAG: hypothetical protein PHI63_02145 [Patescibacteria group bacterium]|nr:hypothetical protein [Patescibacteria group bacterium]
MKRLGVVVLAIFVAAAAYVLMQKANFRKNFPSPVTAVIQPEPGSEEYRYDLSAVTTVGNHSYIPLNLSGPAAVHVKEILGVVDAFEQAHAELVVGIFDDESRQDGMNSHLYGLWVHHRPK